MYKVLQMNPLGTRKKPEPEMGFEPTTLHRVDTKALTSELLETLW